MKLKTNSIRKFHHVNERRICKDKVGLFGSKIKHNLDTVKNVNGHIRFIIKAVLNLGQQ